jgi:hypothetical protein
MSDRISCLGTLLLAHQLLRPQFAAVDNAVFNFAYIRRQMLRQFITSRPYELFPIRTKPAQKYGWR